MDKRDSPAKILLSAINLPNDFLSIREDTIGGA